MARRVHEVAAAGLQRYLGSMERQGIHVAEVHCSRPLVHCSRSIIHHSRSIIRRRSSFLHPCRFLVGGVHLLIGSQIVVLSTGRLRLRL